MYCINNKSSHESCINVSLTVSGVVLVISALICAIVLITLLNNHLNATVWNKMYNNLTLLTPGAVSVLWSIAKYTGIIALTALGIGGVTVIGAAALAPRF